MSIVFDIAVVAIVVLFAIWGYRRGLMRTAFGLVGYIAAAGLSYLLSTPIANWVYNTFIRSATSDFILSSLSDGAKEQGIQTAVDQVIDALPKSIVAFLPESSIKEVTEQLSQATPSNQEIASAVMEHLIYPVAIAIIQLFTVIFLFLLLCIVVKTITKMLKIVDKLPIIGKLNSGLGLVIGLGEAIVFLTFFTGAVAIMIQLSGDQWETVNRSVIEQTYLFRFLYHYNPLISLK